MIHSDFEEFCKSLDSCNINQSLGNSSSSKGINRRFAERVLKSNKNSTPQIRVYSLRSRLLITIKGIYSFMHINGFNIINLNYD